MFGYGLALFAFVSTAAAPDILAPSRELHNWHGNIAREAVARLPRGIQTNVALSQLESAKGTATFRVVVISDNRTLRGFANAAGGFFPRGTAATLNEAKERLLLVVLERDTNAIRVERLKVAEDGAATLVVEWDQILPKYVDTYPATCRIFPRDIKSLRVELGDGQRLVTFRFNSGKRCSNDLQHQ